MKRKYDTPCMNVEIFTPNEYVATCWGVACSLGLADNGGPTPDPAPWTAQDVNHTCRADKDSTGCGHFENQAIQQIEGTDTYQMVEIHTLNLGNLNCQIASDSKYSQLSDTISNVHVGDTIYWITTKGKRTWHHTGVISSQNATNFS